jgi:hypothetical protein
VPVARAEASAETEEHLFADRIPMCFVHVTHRAGDAMMGHQRLEVHRCHRPTSSELSAQESTCPDACVELCFVAPRGTSAERPLHRSKAGVSVPSRPGTLDPRGHQIGGAS